MKFAPTATLLSVSALAAAAFLPSGVDGIAPLPSKKESILQKLRGSDGASMKVLPGTNDNMDEKMTFPGRFLGDGTMCPPTAAESLADRDVPGYDSMDPNPVVVDGEPTEWIFSGTSLDDLSLSGPPPYVPMNDQLEWLYNNHPYFIAPMYEAWNPEKSNPKWVSNVFGRFDCAYNQVCFLVMATKDETGQFLYSFTGASNWAKQFGPSPNPDLDGTIKDIFDPNNPSVIIGWEGCFNYHATLDGCYGFAMHATFCDYNDCSSRSGTTGTTSGNGGGAVFQIHTGCTCTTNDDCDSSSTGCYYFYCNTENDANVCLPMETETLCACNHDSQCGTPANEECDDVRCIDNECFDVPKDPKPATCGGGDEPSTCDEAECALSFDGDEICAEKVCMDLVCVTRTLSEHEDEPCGVDATAILSGEENRTYPECDRGFRCSSGECVHVWEEPGTACTSYVGTIDFHDGCFDLQCVETVEGEAATECRPIQRNETHVCEPAGLFGECYGGTLCGVEGKCDVPTYLPEGTECFTSDVEFDFATGCYDLKCIEGEDAIICGPVQRNETTQCEAIGAHGICDGGSLCGPLGLCDAYQYLGNSVVCNSEILGCCDEIDRCNGSSWDCPPAFKFDVACRACQEDGCDANPVEYCDGLSIDCPKDVLFEDHYCVKAGQDTPVGSVDVTVMDTDGNGVYKFCVTMDLSDGFSLDPGSDEAVKFYIKASEQPGSDPGRYNYKFPSNFFDVGQREFCWPLADFTDDIDCFSIFFAFHFDVVSWAGDQDTAWARTCNPDMGDIGQSALAGNRFKNKNGNAFRGWGEFYEWTCTCPKECPDCFVGDKE